MGARGEQVNPTTAKIEGYLETIYNMEMENEVVYGARLAEKFHVKPPSVTEILQRMEKQGYISMNDRRHVQLTASGVEMAEDVLRRHRLAERFLVDMLKMQWHEVHEEACKIEHNMSGAFEQHVIAALGHPTTCPHGNPIPGYVPDARGYLARNHAMRLPETNGDPMRILCVSEVVEDEEETIRSLHDFALTPGAEVLWLGQQDTQCTIQRGTTTLAVPFALARALWVIPRNMPFPDGASVNQPV